MSDTGIHFDVTDRERAVLMNKTLAELTQAAGRGPAMWLLDLSVTANDPQLPVEQYTFTLTLRPSILDIILNRPPYMISVPIVLYDDIGNVAVIPPLEMSSRGQTITKTVEVPITDRTKLQGRDPGRRIYVWVDPLNSIHEKNEGDNRTSAWCYTVG